MERPKMNPVNFRPRKVVDITPGFCFGAGIMVGAIAITFILALIFHFSRPVLG